jgi:hypothetical protein
MKSIVILFTATFVNISILLAQAPPQGINYQAVVYNDNGNNQPGLNVPGQVLRNKSIQVRFTLIQNSAFGTEVYKEVHTTTTDAFGMFSLVIGEGIQQGNATFSSINWGTGKHFLKVEIDKNGTTNFVTMSNQQLLSVPYALYSDKASYATSSGNGISSVSDNGNGTLTFSYFDGSTYTTPVLTGLQGEQGIQGVQGPAGQNGTNGINGTNGQDGQDGLSAYQIWLSLGNTGSESDFINSLTGPQGNQGISGSNGTNGKNTLAKTSNEVAGVNCVSGGIKIEYGLDINNNGTLDLNEINTSLTKFICNGSNSSNNIISPTILTNSATNITSNSSTFSATISGAISSQIIERGFVYSFTTNPNIQSNKIIVGSGIGDYSFNTNYSFGSSTLLLSNRVYYLKAYVVTENGITLYGNEVSFTTLPTGQTSSSGGIVFFDKGFYSDGWRYLEISPSEVGNAPMGCNGTATPGTSQSVGSGQSNTNLIISTCSTIGIAARACDNYELNGFTDWYLPSRYDLNLVRYNLYENGVGNIPYIVYWSSSIASGTANAWQVQMGGAFVSSERNKLDAIPFRAARSF